MKIIHYITAVLFFPVLLSAQWGKDTTGYPLFRFTFSYGISSTNAEKSNLDFHVMKNSSTGANPDANQFVQYNGIIQKLEDMMITLSTRPLVDNKLIMLRFGRMNNAYRFTTEIGPSGTSSGSMTIETTEKYTVYPVSFGVGISTARQNLQLQGEIIYAFATMIEDQTISASDGTQFTIPSTTYRSETIGFRLAVQLNVYISQSIALVFEGGYRGLGFYDFTNSANGETVGLEYTTSGGFLHAGLSYGWQ